MLCGSQRELYHQFPDDNWIVSQKDSHEIRKMNNFIYNILVCESR